MRELEFRVLDVLWDAGGPLVPSDVRDRLDVKRPLAYTTVNTVLVRLWEKGLLKRVKSGRAYAYRVVQTRADYFARRMNEILQTSGDHKEALASFVETIGAKDRVQLRRMLERKRTR